MSSNLTEARKASPGSRLRRGGLAGLAVAFVLVTPLAASAQERTGAAGSVKKVAKDAGTTVTKTASRSRKGTAAAAPAASAKPALAGTYGDWSVFVSQGPKTKICYALGQPKDRAPAALKREASYVFISNRPGEGVRNEVSIILGMTLKDNVAGARAEIGSTGFDLVTKGQNAFIKNAAEEGQFVDALKRRGGRLVVKIPAEKRQVVTDTYSLGGIGQALERIGKDCS